ncbi:MULTISPECIES: tetratricopeptide repeat protein [Actinosynnema]|uniref:tetratricopeptide repeat protein n=1 Tax=Actinosynnema TaxID=40566 RepID=UPI0020A48370|nr:tetratricopeptide repeat protein [Actinosynnema pretiosum]MCP2099465.1 Tetratricopeptide repeat-containing protein [Actinosynnema pretiosum]
MSRAIVESVAQVGYVAGDINFHRGVRRSLEPVRQLPVPPRWLVGRESALQGFDAAARRAVEAGEVALLVVEGGPGIGKTALALNWAHRNAETFPDGQLFADLGAGGSPNAPVLSVLLGFLAALGVDPAVAHGDLASAAALYRSAIAERRMVVVLDNAGSSAQVEPLLPGTSSCVAVITSRSRLSGLRVLGATVHRLHPLGRADSLALLARYLGDRAETDPASAAVFLDCCAGLPLALAIVAARAAEHPEFALSVLADELGDVRRRLDALETGEPGGGLRAVLSWSYEALDEQAARAFRAVGAIPGEETTAPVLGWVLGILQRDAETLLRVLEARNLLWQRTPGRYTAHALLKLFGCELSARAAESEDVARGCVDHYARTARRADLLLYPHRAVTDLQAPVEEPEPVPLPDEEAALRWFTEEHSQLLAAYEAALERRWDEHAFQLSRVLDTYQHRRSLLRANLATSAGGAVAADRLGHPRWRVLAHRQLGRALTRVGLLDEALAELEETTGLADLLADALEAAHTHHDLARARARLGDQAGALHDEVRARELYAAAGNRVGEGHALNGMARCHAELGELGEARRCCEDALRAHRREGNKSGSLVALDNLGFIEQRMGRGDAAVRAYRDALVLCSEGGHSFYEAVILEHLGLALVEQGEGDEARATLLRAVRLYEEQHRLVDVDRLRARVLPEVEVD